MVVNAKKQSQKAENHLKSIEDIRKYLNVGLSKMKEILRACRADPQAPQFPGKRVEGKGPHRATAAELDAWWAAYVEYVNRGRTARMRRVDPKP